MPTPGPWRHVASTKIAAVPPWNATVDLDGSLDLKAGDRLKIQLVWEPGGGQISVEILASSQIASDLAW